jgi:hypothetical protein
VPGLDGILKAQGEQLPAGNKPLKAGRDVKSCANDRRGRVWITDADLQAVNALKVKKPISAVLWKMGAGLVTEKPARGMNPGARSVA